MTIKGGEEIRIKTLNVALQVKSDEATFYCKVFIRYSPVFYSQNRQLAGATDYGITYDGIDNNR